MMTNLEKLKIGTDKEVKKILITLAYRSLNYTKQERQVKEFLKEKVNS